ncbi:MAG: DUF4012 domain-containing protein [Patescibacteria group bacterium]|jgi:hypothetical protein
MNIKKYRIDISDNDQSSEFVVDLSSPAEIKPEISESSRIKPLPLPFVKKNKKRFNFFQKIRDYGDNLNFSRLKQIFIFQVFLFFFKIIKVIFYFFLDWIIDIFKFFQKFGVVRRVFHLFFVFLIFSTRVLKKIFLNLFIFVKKNVFSKKKKKPLLELKPEKIIAKINPPKISFKVLDYKVPSGKKTIGLFILLLFLLIIPFKVFSYYKLAKNNSIKSNLEKYSQQGLENFILASEGVSNLDLSNAQNNFFQAGQNFLLFEEELKNIDQFVIFLASFSSKEDLKLASESKNIAKVGIYLSSAGDNFSLALNSLIKTFSDSSTEDDLTDLITYIQKTEADFKKVSKYFKKIKLSSVPDEYQEQFLDIEKKINILNKNLDNLPRIIAGLENFLGFKNDKRYLVVFQNNNEIRATGGFIGSYALVDLSRGKIKKIEVPAGGSYDTEGGMQVLVQSPKPLHLVRPLWHFWDANWWPDWKVSAQNLAWFYDKSGGSSVDGVIGITPDVLGDILEITGPINMTDKYGVIIDSNNFWEIIQEIVEVVGQPEVYQDKVLKTDILSRVELEKELADNLENNIAVESDSADLLLEETEKEKNDSSDLLEENGFLKNEPKKIIGDLMSEVIGYFSNNFDKDLLVKTSKILENNLNKKNILLYFDNSNLQTEVENRSWAGRVKGSSFDYLMIVNSNIAGGKTDLYIENKFDLEVKIDEDGNIINKLTIKRKHLGTKGDLFSGVRNVDWLRIYVPLGSTLISSTGFSQPDSSYFKKTEDFYEKNSLLESGENRAEINLESGTKIYQELNKTVFANWTMVDPGQEVILELEYKLPFNFNYRFQASNPFSLLDIFRKEKKKNYSLLWQKQPGALDSNLDLKITNNLNLISSWSHPENISNSSDSVIFSEILDIDRYLVTILE